MDIQNKNIDNIISLEVKRLTDKYHKEYFSCEDIMKITGLGRDNVRTIMSKTNFPTVKVGRRIVVSVSGFVMWQFENMR